MTLERHQSRIIQTSLGRIVAPTELPADGFVFWTSTDFDGRLDAQSTRAILAVAGELGGGASRLETCQQVHGTDSVEVTSAAAGWSECASCDALWTRRSGVALGIKVADCLPVTIIEESATGGVVINVHAGWRGAAAGIVGETVRTAFAESSVPSSEVHAWLGPSIRVCCFEVGEEVVDAFRATHPFVDEFVDRSKRKPHIDLAGMTKRALVGEGIAEDRIWDGGLCTRCPDSLFHSYRRSGPRAGRNLAVAGR